MATEVISSSIPVAMIPSIKEPHFAFLEGDHRVPLPSCRQVEVEYMHYNLISAIIVIVPGLLVSRG